MSTSTKVAGGVVAVILTLAGIPSRAQAKPDFAGEWTLNLTKSHFGQVQAPSGLVRTITQQGSRFKVVTIQPGASGNVTTEVTYTIDGKDNVHKLNGETVRAAARWEGEALIIESRRRIQGAEAIQRDRWTLSLDGKTLTINSHLTVFPREYDITYVLDKH